MINYVHAYTHTHTHTYIYICEGEGNGKPLQCSCLENPRDGRAWWAAVYGVAQSRTQLKWLSNSNIYIYIFLGKYPRQVWSLKHYYTFIEYESLCSSPWLINQKHLLIFFPWLTDNKISKIDRRRSYKILCIWFLDIDPFYKEKANSLPFFPWWVKYFWITT